MSLRFGNFISLNPSNPHHPPIPSGPPLWHGATLDSDLLRCIAVTMGRKRSSLSSGLKYTDIENTKMGKGKKRRRDSVPGVVTTPDAARDSEPRALPGGSRTDSSKSVVLQRAPEDSVNPILVSFANQTVPADVESLQFTVQHGEGKGREGEKVVMSEGPRYVRQRCSSYIYCSSLDTTLILLLTTQLHSSTCGMSRASWRSSARATNPDLSFRCTICWYSEQQRCAWFTEESEGVYILLFQGSTPPAGISVCVCNLRPRTYDIPGLALMFL